MALSLSGTANVDLLSLDFMRDEYAALATRNRELVAETTRLNARLFETGETVAALLDHLGRDDRFAAEARALAIAFAATSGEDDRDFCGVEASMRELDRLRREG